MSATTNKPFILKYLLPDGTLAGYHADSCCTVTTKKRSAKVYNSRPRRRSCNINKQIAIVRENFNYVWKTVKEYRSYPIWQGTKSSKKIEIEAEKI